MTHRILICAGGKTSSRAAQPVIVDSINILQCIMVDSILTCGLLVGGALEWGSSGIVANQAGKPARWTAGKSKDIILHISSASLGAHQGDRLHFFRGALPIDRCSLPQCVGCKKNQQQIAWLTIWFRSLILAQCKASQIYNQLNKYRTLSQTKCLQCAACLRHHKKKWMSFRPHRFFDKISTSNPTPSSLTNIPAAACCCTQASDDGCII